MLEKKHGDYNFIDQLTNLNEFSVNNRSYIAFPCLPGSPQGHLGWKVALPWLFTVTGYLYSRHQLKVAPQFCRVVF